MPQHTVKKSAIVASLLLGLLTACAPDTAPETVNDVTDPVQDAFVPTPKETAPATDTEPEKPEWEEAPINDGFVTPEGTTIIAPVEEVSAQGVNGWYAALDIAPGTEMDAVYNNILAQFQERDIPASILDPEEMVEPEVEGTGVIMAEGEKGKFYERYSLEIIPPVGDVPGEIYWLAALEPLPEPEAKDDAATNDD